MSRNKTRWVCDKCGQSFSTTLDVKEAGHRYSIDWHVMRKVEEDE